MCFHQSYLSRWLDTKEQGAEMGCNCFWFTPVEDAHQGTCVPPGDSFLISMDALLQGRQKLFICRIIPVRGLFCCGRMCLSSSLAENEIFLTTILLQLVLKQTLVLLLSQGLDSFSYFKSFPPPAVSNA